MRLLPSCIEYESVYNLYEQQWDSLCNANIEIGSLHLKPSGPLSFVQFRNVWRNYFEQLKIWLRGSDFCDYCVTINNRIGAVSDPERLDLIEQLRVHKEIAQNEYQIYNKIRKIASLYPTREIVHLVFDFAEKVTLPSMERQPGQLHFVTGLKYDIFGISLTKLNITNVYGLSEGH